MIYRITLSAYQTPLTRLGHPDDPQKAPSHAMLASAPPDNTVRSGNPMPGHTRSKPEFLFTWSRLTSLLSEGEDIHVLDYS